MTQVSLNLLGYAQGNAQMTAEVWDPATNLKIAEARVLADGSVRMANIAAGAYQVRIRYPNLVAEVATQTIYVPAAGEARVSMLINPDKFTNLSITDVPDADLEPLAAMAQSVELAAAGLTNKMPGEILTAAWANGIALAMRDLAHVVTALSRSVTPVGHNHLEYENKINEMSANFESLVQAIAESTVQMQRRFEIQKLRSRIEDVFEVSTDQTSKAEVLAILTAMEANIVESPQLYSQRMRAAAGTIKAKLAPIIAKLPATAAQIVAEYNAVIAVWTSRSIKDLRDELISTKVEASLPRTRFDIPVDESQPIGNTSA